MIAGPIHRFDEDARTKRVPAFVAIQHSNFSVMKKTFSLICLLGALLLLSAHSLQACACGCGVFDVGTSWNFPSGPGGMIYSEYNFASQSQNWNNLGPSAAVNNDDKLIQTSWLTTGVQYFWNNKWGAELVVPSANRMFTRSNEDPGAPAGSTITTKWWSLGDIRLNGYYTGFSPDMSTGITFGVKLPTGNWNEPGVDRDTQIGTGSTDLLLGFFTRHHFSRDQKWSWFLQSQLDAPVIISDGYRPGIEVDSAAGIYYTGLHLGKVKIRPIAQAIVSNRASDTGINADTQNTGYQRVLLSPGIEFDIHPIRIYADAELPVIDSVVGQQLVSQCMVKVNLSYMF